nr:MAG TPA: hypothetical protein [Caudoviricetes sp.]
MRPYLLAFTFFFDGISVYAFCFALRPLLRSLLYYITVHRESQAF